MLWVALGFLSGFLVLYSLHMKRPYPTAVLNTLDEPWIIALLVLVTGVVYTWDERVALLLAIILIFFLVDVYFLGKQ